MGKWLSGTQSLITPIHGNTVTTVVLVIYDNVVAPCRGKAVKVIHHAGIMQLGVYYVVIPVDTCHMTSYCLTQHTSHNETRPIIYYDKCLGLYIM